MRLIGNKGDPLAVRVWGRCVANGNGCLIWTGAKAGKGYGHIRAGAKMAYVHRIALEHRLGRPLGAGLCALHSCDEPLCCNPAHLWEGSNDDNIADRQAKGRSLTGERNHKSALTESAAREIRRRYKLGEKQRAL